MKLSFGTVFLIFIVTLVHIAVIALLSPVDGFDWGKESTTKTTKIDVLIEDALNASEDIGVVQPESTEDAPTPISEAEDQSPKGEKVAQADPPIKGDAEPAKTKVADSEPVARFEPNRFRERVRPPELADVAHEQPAADAHEEERAQPPRIAADSHSEKSREFRQITPIPRS